MAYGEFKDLTNRTAADKVLEIRHLKLRVIENMMDIKEN